MRSLLLCASVLVVAGSAPFSAQPQVENRTEAIAACAPTGASYTRTTLYFGLARPAGTITAKQWDNFVHDEITSRFPEGFTIWEAHGQWRRADGKIARERAKVLLIVHANTTSVRDSVSGLVESYKKSFEQESVLWETATVCAAF